MAQFIIEAVCCASWWRDRRGVRHSGRQRDGVFLKLTPVIPVDWVVIG